MFLLLLKPMKLDYSILRKEHPPSYFTSEVAVIHEVLSLFFLDGNILIQQILPDLHVIKDCLAFFSLVF